MRVAGFCIRSVVAILPIGSITPVSNRNFYIPAYSGSPDLFSALRLLTFPGFGPVNKTVASLLFLPCAALRRPGGFHKHRPFSFCLLSPDLKSIIGIITTARVVNTFTPPTLQPAFQLSGNQSCIVANSSFSFPFPVHPAMPLFLFSLRLISSACCTPADSFRLTGFLVG